MSVSVRWKYWESLQLSCKSTHDYILCSIDDIPHKIDDLCLASCTGLFWSLCFGLSVCVCVCGVCVYVWVCVCVLCVSVCVYVYIFVH